LGAYGKGRIKVVERPTTAITDDGQRIDLRETAYGLAERGEYGPAIQRAMATKLPEKYPLSAAQKNVIDHIALLEGEKADRIAPVPDDPEILTNHVKAAGYFLKADLMAACHVPEKAYYSHDKFGNEIEPKYKNAIIIAMGKEKKAVRASTGSDWLGDPISFQAYQHVGMVAETLANYIRRLGWDAVPNYGPSFVNKYQVQLPRLLLEAGIGEVSRIGIILNPYLGVSYKAAAILTDMPIVPDKPIDFGLQNFCQHCKICAENCPSRAISFDDKVMYNGYETWKLNTRRCASFNFTNKRGTMCNTCVKSCPWSNPTTWEHNLVRRLAMGSQLAQRIAIQGAKWQKTGEGHPEEKWWFDMEYVADEIELREKK